VTATGHHSAELNAQWLEVLSEGGRGSPPRRGTSMRYFERRAPPRPDVVKRAACMWRWSSSTQIRTCAARPVVLFFTKMRSAAVNTRDRILSDGVDLLSQVGLAGVTLGMLAEKVGLSKSGLFAHFLSKTEVQIAILNQAADVANAHVVAPAMQVSVGLPRLRTLVNRWLGWTTRAGLPGGCPIVAAMFEVDDIEGDVRDMVSQLEASWRALLTGLVQEAVEHGHLRHDLDVDQFVWELCGIYLSHHASWRFIRDPECDARAAKAFESLVGNALSILPPKIAAARDRIKRTNKARTARRHP
jgi:AcrR family transcriptional regulator